MAYDDWLTTELEYDFDDRDTCVHGVGFDEVCEECNEDDGESPNV